jgi:hypothetical protein
MNIKGLSKLDEMTPNSWTSKISTNKYNCKKKFVI